MANKAVKAATVKKVAQTEPKFTKQQILQADEFLGDIDVLNALLPDDAVCTKSEVKDIKDEFYRKVVG